MKKKMIGWMLVVLAGVLLLTACSTKKTEDKRTETAGSQAADTPVPENPLTEAAEVQIPEVTPETEAKETAEEPVPDVSQEPMAEDLWNGTFLGDGESVTLSRMDETGVFFSFAQSGISGTATLDGAQAVYYGDDQHEVTFQLSDTILEVVVLSGEGQDASGSPLNGTYIRES